MALGTPRVPPRLGAAGFRLIAGIVVAALGFALTLRARLGLGPWHVVQQGLSGRVEITVGTAVVLVNAVLLLVAWRLRERPGSGTVAVVALLGPAVDGFLAVVPEFSDAFPRAGALGSGLVLMALGGALVISAGLGVSPLDSVMIGAFRHLPSASLAGVRLAMETGGLTLGWLLGGAVGVGTVVIGLGIGPVLHAWLRLLRAVPERPEAKLVAA